MPNSCSASPRGPVSTTIPRAIIVNLHTIKTVLSKEIESLENQTASAIKHAQSFSLRRSRDRSLHHAATLSTLTSKSWPTLAWEERGRRGVRLRRDRGGTSLKMLLHPTLIAPAPIDRQRSASAVKLSIKLWVHQSVTISHMIGVCQARATINP